MIIWKIIPTWVELVVVVVTLSIMVRIIPTTITVVVNKVVEMMVEEVELIAMYTVNFVLKLVMLHVYATH